MSLSYVSNADTGMCVKAVDGEIVKYDVEKVSEVYYESDFEFETENLFLILLELNFIIHQRW